MNSSVFITSQQHPISNTAKLQYTMNERVLWLNWMVGKGNPKNTLSGPLNERSGVISPQGSPFAICLWVFADTMIEAPKFAELCLSTWVCLKIGYTPNYSHLVGIMISKTIGCRGTLFSDKPTSFIAIPTCLTSLASSGFMEITTMMRFQVWDQWIQRKILIKLKTVWYWRLSLSMSWGFEMFWAVSGFWSYLVWCNDRLIPTWQAMFFQGIRRWYRIPHYVSGWYSIA